MEPAPPAIELKEDEEIIIPPMWKRESQIIENSSPTQAIQGVFGKLEPEGEELVALLL